MLLIGYFIGSKCRSRRDKLPWVGTLLFVTITLLLSAMGVRMGSNKEVMENLHTLGFDALIITLMIMAGNIIAVMITRKFLGIDRYGRLKGLEALDESKASIQDISPKDSPEELTDKKGSSGKRMTISILSFILLGIICGYLFVPKLFPDYSYFEAVSGNIMTFCPAALLFFLGLDLGLTGTIVNNLKQAGFKVLAFPVAVIVGTLVAAFLAGLILSTSQKETLAIGAGFGWPSLGPAIISGQGYVMAGAISFIHNMIRQLGGIVLIPLVAQRIGYIEAASLPGIASMDIALPLVEKSCGERIVIYSFLIGLMQSAAAPVLVSLFISL